MTEPTQAAALSNTCAPEALGIEPTVRMAITLHANPGAYACLLGSGISFTSGIPTGWGMVLDLVSRVAELPLEFSPGSAWNYSISTDVCGRLVEVISGERFDDYLRRHLFDPLGMEDTDFHVPEEKRERFAACYQRAPGRKTVLMDDPERSSYLRPPRFLGGGGGLVSTAHDYLRFCRMLLDGGSLDGTRILSRKTLALMTSNHLTEGRDMASAALGDYTEIALPGAGFGLGFAVTLDPVRAGVVGTPGEFAWGGAASTIFLVDPAEELIVIYLTQLFPSGSFNFRGQLKSIVYGSIDD